MPSADAGTTSAADSARTADGRIAARAALAVAVMEALS
jgi:hypothetical protein